jgi:hypothetical protein
LVFFRTTNASISATSSTWAMAFKRPGPR